MTVPARKKLSRLFFAYQNVRGLNIKLPKLYADSSSSYRHLQAYKVVAE